MLSITNFDGTQEHNVVTDQDGRIEIDLLWTNPKQNAAFPSQNISVPNIRQYSFYLIMYKYIASESITFSQIAVVGEGSYLPITETNAYGARYISFVSQESINVSPPGVVKSDGSYIADANYIIPKYIYGIKGVKK